MKSMKSMKSLKESEQDAASQKSQKRSLRSSISTLSWQDLDEIEMVSVAPCNLLDDDKLSVSSGTKATLLDIKANKDKTYSWWTPKENEALTSAIYKHGINYRLLSKAVVARDIKQIRKKLQSFCEDIKADKDHPNRDLLP